MVFMLPVIFGAALAAAISTALTIDFDFRDKATAERDGSITVRGVVTCSAQTTVTVDGQVSQELNKGKLATGAFAADVPCNTTPTTWIATVAADTGLGFRPGAASIGARAAGLDPASGAFTGVQTSGVLQLTRSSR